MSVEKRFIVKSLFTGKEWLSHQEVILDGNRLVYQGPIQHEYPEIDLLIPSFIDLQVYGAAGKLFSAFPSWQTLDLMHQEFTKSGTHYFLPTIATNDFVTIQSGILAIKEYWKNGGMGCLGLHLEGPWISPEKRGAHDKRYIRVPAITEVKQLLVEGEGVIKMITLAPEVCNKEVLAYLSTSGILLSAGHSTATFEQGIQAFSTGVSLVTHLFNAMSPLQHRSPGLVGAAFMHEHVMASIIPDGYHVDWSVIKLSKQVMNNRLFVITDAVTACDKAPYRHSLYNDHYVANGVLSGSALTMLDAFNNLIFKVGLTVQESVLLCVSNPARAFKMDRLSSFSVGAENTCIPLMQKEQRFEIIN
ncbi:MAG: N-acetylglucosamine-6-phosphate deacetylase [Bacteroidetes bacterium]|nr:N-acetylglucosamine-6-phosphate deacetylase [Bacteroidota bacterium]